MATKTRNWVPLYVSLLAVCALAIFALSGKSLGIVLNVTGSMPDWVYQLGHGERGSMVAFCSPISHSSIGRGPCPDGSMPLIKRVAGVANDLVAATDAGIEINGQPVPNSKPLDLDTQGSALPHLRGLFKLKQGEIWTAGEHANSFDSRYFGPVNFPTECRPLVPSFKVRR